MKKYLTWFLCLMMIALGGQFGWQTNAVFAKDEAKQVTMKSCIEECTKCQKACEETLAYCKKKGGKLADKELTNALKDCVQSCKLSADYMTRMSASHMKSCGFCAEICKACAEACEKFKGDKQLEQCAQECRKCNESCEAMASGHHKM